MSYKFNNKGAKNNRHRRFQGGNFGDERGSSQAVDSFRFNVPGSGAKQDEIHHWLDSHPRLEALQEYCQHANDRSGNFSFASYSERLAQQICFKAKERKDHTQLITNIFSNYQSAVFRALESIHKSQTTLTPELAKKIIHACTFLKISHPVLSDAIPAFFKLVRNKSITFKDAVDFCLDLSRNANLFAAGASDKLLSCLLDHQALLPGIDANTQPLHVKFQYTCALNGNADHDSIASSLNKIGLPVLRSDSINHYIAILWMLASPEGKLPRHIEDSIKASRKQQLIAKGRIEDRYGKQIRKSIIEACAPWSKSPLIEGGQDVPNNFYGPYHTDFLTRLDISGRKESFAIEINGSQHYCLSPAGMILHGADTLKQNILEKFGTKYIGIPNHTVKEFSDREFIQPLIRELRRTIINLIKHRSEGTNQQES